jgi:hypothetical protein
MNPHVSTLFQIICTYFSTSINTVAELGIIFSAMLDMCCSLSHICTSGVGYLPI